MAARTVDRIDDAVSLHLRHHRGLFHGNAADEINPHGEPAAGQGAH